MMASKVQSIHELAKDDANLLALQERLADANRDEKNAKGYTVLHCAAEGKATKNLEYIMQQWDVLQNHKLLTIKSNKGFTPVHLAAEHCEKSTMDYILHDLNTSQRFEILSQADACGRTPLHWAALDDKIDMVLCMIQSLIEDSDKTKAMELIHLKDSSSQTTLHEVASKGRSDMLMTMLGLFEPNTRLQLIIDPDNKGRTSFHFAILSTIPAAVKEILTTLLEGEATRTQVLTATQNGGHTPLHLAIAKNNGTIIQDILECLSKMSQENKRKVLAAKDKVGRNCLHSTVQERSTVALETVLHCLEPDEQVFLLTQFDCEGDTPMHDAASLENPIILQTILKCLHDPINKFKVAAFADAKLRSSLHRAVNTDSEETVRGLVDCLEDSHVIELLRSKHQGGQTPLHVAMEKNNMKIVEIFLSFLNKLPATDKLDIISAADLTGRTCLHTAVHEKNADVVKVLLSHVTQDEMKKFLDMRDDDGDTVLHDAVALGGTKVTKAILDCIEDTTKRTRLIMIPDSKLRTSLHRAVINGGADLVECIFYSVQKSDHLELLNAKHRGGQTPLHVATAKGNASITKVLLQCVNEIDSEETKKTLFLAKDIPGRTCLHTAVEGDNSDVVRMVCDVLVKNGWTDAMSIKDCSGDTALDDALTGSKVQMMKIMMDSLTSHSDRYQLAASTDRRLRTSLHCAVISDSVEAVKSLINCLDYEDAVKLMLDKHQGGQTPLCVAVSKGNLDIVEFFMEFLKPDDRYDVIVKPDDELDTALHLAAFAELNSQKELNTVRQLEKLKKGLEQGLKGLLAAQGAQSMQQSMQQLLRGLGNEASEEEAESTEKRSKSKINHVDFMKCMLDSLSERRFEALEKRNLFGHTAVHIAAARGSAKALEYMLTTAQPSQGRMMKLVIKKNEDGHTPLHITCDYNRADLAHGILRCIPENELVSFLCEQDLAGRTALHLALKAKKTKKSKKIMSQPAELVKCFLNYLDSKQCYDVLSKKNLEGRSAFLLAILEVDVESITCMLKKLTRDDAIALVKETTCDGITPLQEAFAEPSLVKQLLDHFGDQVYSVLSCRNDDGKSFLHRAAIQTDHRLVSILLESLPDNEKLNLMSMKDFSGQNILHIATSTKPRSSIEKLIGSLCAYTSAVCSLLCATDDRGKTAVDVALDQACAQYLQQLLAKHAAKLPSLEKILAPNSDCSSAALLQLNQIDPTINQTLLHSAVQFGLMDVVRSIIERLDSQDLVELLKVQDWLGNSAIHLAAQSVNIMLLEHLSNLGQELRAQLLARLNENRENCLHMAVHSCPPEVVLKLVRGIEQPEMKRLLEQKDFKGQNVLHAAAKRSIATVRDLLSISTSFHSELLSQEDDKGMVVADVATEVKLQKYLAAFKDFYFLHKPPKCVVIFMRASRKGNVSTVVDEADNEMMEMVDALEEVGIKNPAIHEDLNEAQIFNVLTTAAKDSNMSALVVCIMAHGDKSCILDVDEQRIPIESIISKMCPDNLSGKPKILLVQACQGKNYPEGLLESQPLESSSRAPEAASENVEPNSIPVQEDVTLIYATVPGQMARRNHFIPIFASQLKKSDEDTGIVDIYTKTHEEMKKHPQFYQKPVFIMTLRKKFSFKRVWDS